MPPPKPTEAELEILAALWIRGPSTVREIHDHLNRRTGYTSVLKFLQIMTDKGLVRRDDANRTHIYRAATDQSHTQRRLVNDLIQKAFDGSARKLILAALASKKATSAEIEEIKQLLAQYKGAQK